MQKKNQNLLRKLKISFRISKKICLNLWSLFHSYFLHLKESFKKVFFIQVRILKKNRPDIRQYGKADIRLCGHRIYNYPASRISEKLNWISSLIPDIKKSRISGAGTVKYKFSDFRNQRLGTATRIWTKDCTPNPGITTPYWI